MAKIYKAAQFGYGQLGKPWFHYVSCQHHWQINLVAKVKDLDPKVHDCVFLAVNDESIESLISSLSVFDFPIYHFSGSRYFQSAIGLHPVYSFSQRNDDVDFRTLNWVLDSKKTPESIKRLLGNSIHYVEPVHKKIYHSYLSIAANMSQLLSYLMSESFSEKTNLPQNLLKNLVIQSLKNEKKYGSQSFSGPWVRNEKKIQDEIVKGLKDNFLIKNNENFNELIEVYNEHYRL